MPVIALTQEMGSLAKDIAIRLADEMKLAMLRHEVVEHVASRMHVSKSLITRLREGKAGMIERARADQRSMAVYSAEEVLDAAAGGNIVLRGWGATCLLRPVPHAICVRITRPFEKRVEWLMNHLETDDAEAAADEVRRSDQAHASRMHAVFGVTWGDPLLYDLVLNTERLTVDSCVQLIRDIAARPEFAETPQSQALVQGMALEAHITSALIADDDTHDVRVTIESRNGIVTLTGIVLSDQERARTEQVAAGVEGVKSVDNQLRVMARANLFKASKP
ncbi:MAG: cytidylate kinase family protein [Burkholderiaceae bacterium]